MHCISQHISYVGYNMYNSRSFKCTTAIQMMLILHDSGVFCKLHILDHELDHFHALFYCMTQMLFSHIRFHVVICNASFLWKQIAMIRYGFFTVYHKINKMT